MSAPALPWARTAERLRAPARLPFMRRLSIRWRLTLWYSGVLAVTLMVFSLVVFWFAGTTMLQEVHQASVSQAAQVSELVVRAVRAQAVLTALDREKLLQAGIIQDSVDPFKDPGVGVRVRLYGNGTVAKFASPELADVDRIPDDRSFILEAEHGRARGHQLQTAADGPFYVYSRPVYEAGPPPYLLAVVQVFTSLRPQYDRLDMLARVLMLGTVLGTLLAIVVGAAIAQVALAPIDGITRTASQINRAQDLSRRIPDDGSTDELGRLAVTFNEMLDRIEGMFERQRQLVADVSHELRTPLTTIRGEVDLMTRANRLDPEGLAAMRQESDRMARMVSDLLLLAQADSGLAVERYPVQLADLVTDVLRQARALAPQADRLVLAAVTPVTVLGDADRLRQLLLNLIDNAFKHNPPGTRVRLALWAEDHHAVLTVADDGPGIPPEDLPHLFERFYRVDKARSRSAGGTGLGLSIVKWIVTAHEGTVTVSSAPGQGSTFTVRLPRPPVGARPADEHGP